MKLPDPRRLAEDLRSEIFLVVETVREKGAKRFARVFALAGWAVLLSYAGLYVPARRRLARLQTQISSAKALSLYAEQFMGLRAGLSEAYATLPGPERRTDWLSGAMLDALRAEGLVPQRLQPVQEMEAAGLLFQSQAVAMTARFPEVYRWIRRLEQTRPRLRLQSLSLSKRREPIGANEVVCEIGTVIPKRRLD